MTAALHGAPPKGVIMENGARRGLDLHTSGTVIKQFNYQTIFTGPQNGPQIKVDGCEPVWPMAAKKPRDAESSTTRAEVRLYLNHGQGACTFKGLGTRFLSRKRDAQNPDLSVPGSTLRHSPTL